MEWQYTGSVTKSKAELQRLMDDILMQPEFNKDNLAGFSIEREQRRLDMFSTSSRTFYKDDGWHEVSVDLHMPKEKFLHESEDTAPVYTVTGIWVCKLTTLIRDACQDHISNCYHWVPFKLFHCLPPSSPTTTPPANERLYSEIYNSDAMNLEHEAIQAAGRETGDTNNVEYVVAPILVYSDSTHLTNFGTASLWPIYVWLGNLTKYLRIKPSMFAAHHLVYIPALSATTVHQVYTQVYGEPPSTAVLRLLKQDLMQHIWLLLLDPDFMHAFRHGMLVTCGDGILRHIFPRIFTYSADYPEKCLVACLKHLANCCCPNCLVEKHQIVEMGTQRDLDRRSQRLRQDDQRTQSWIQTIREWIFIRGTPLDSKTIKKTPVGQMSANPTRVSGAFSIRFSEFGHHVYELFVPDLMHEFELGVWKSAFSHLVRILIAAGGNILQKLDERFSLVPTFGRRTIRRFGHNASAMKKLAARDFKQILQCAIPIFKKLLPEPVNGVVLTMLFPLAMWHALAKLRLHSDSTLDTFDIATRALGVAMRTFLNKVCPLYMTKELPKETQQRQARQARARANTGNRQQAPQQPSKPSATKKIFNLATYKYHHLGDYVHSIRLFGTTDNTTSQTGELEHWRPKSFYARMNRNTKMVAQIARQVQRQHVLHKIGVNVHSHKNPTKRRQPALRKQVYQRTRMSINSREPLPAAPADVQFQISDEQRNSVDIKQFLVEHAADPADEDFVIRLKTYLLRRLPGGNTLASDYEPSYAELQSVRIRLNKIYSHKTLRVNYTTYDMRRDQDSINPSTHSDIILYSDDGDSHPFLYARVLGIFHVNIYRAGADLCGSGDSLIQREHVLWVRWFDLDTSAPGGFATCRLHRLKWARPEEGGYRFIAPEDVLRGANLIPVFAHGTQPFQCAPTGVLGIPDNASDNESPDEWIHHYMNFFVDCDIFMRYLGGRIGHR
ncbi:hypothetical protein C8Q80DRAFT_1079612, partial [Daedaleopsis nitida]